MLMMTMCYHRGFLQDNNIWSIKLWSVEILAFVDNNLMSNFILNISVNGVQYTLIFVGYLY